MPTFFTPSLEAMEAVSEMKSCGCSEIYGSRHEVIPAPKEEVIIEHKNGEFVHRDAYEILETRFLNMKYGKTNMRLVRKINRGQGNSHMTPERLYMACRRQVNSLTNEPLVYGQTIISTETINEICRAKIEE